MQAMPMIADAVSETMVRRDMSTLLPGLERCVSVILQSAGFVDLEQCGPLRSGGRVHNETAKLSR
jgi:hypothetical protein